MNNHFIHIISFNVPLPANYGGVIDVFYKIKSLHQQGVKIILHNFTYGRPVIAELEKYCVEVHYYNRPLKVIHQISTLPFIVKTRNAKALLQNLQKDNYPILFEGLHTCYFLNHEGLKNRKKYIRMHNVEWQYYAHLAEVETNIFKKSYFKIESAKLRRFEKGIENVNGLLAISKNDAAYFGENYPAIPTHFISAFHPHEKVTAQKGRGDYLLFHGDLSVRDNERAAFFLLEKIMGGLELELVIAGLNPSGKLKNKISEFSNVTLRANVEQKVMEDLIQNAHVNVLLSFQSAGMKLKLLNALYGGRFCVVNGFMVGNSGLENLCEVGETVEDFQRIIRAVFEREFSEEEIVRRKLALENQFSNERLAKRMNDIIFRV